MSNKNNDHPEDNRVCRHCVKIPVPGEKSKAFGNFCTLEIKVPTSYTSLMVGKPGWLVANCSGCDFFEPSENQQDDSHRSPSTKVIPITERVNQKAKALRSKVINQLLADARKLNW